MHAPRSLAVIPLLLAAITTAHAQSPPLEVVGRLKLPYPSREIAVRNNLAALTLYPISGGKSEVRLIDVADPAQPRLVATLSTPHYVEHMDPRLLGVTTPTFTGQLLAVGTFNGGPRTGDGAAQFWDVGNPSLPRLIGRVPTLYGVRSLDLVQREGRLLALLAVNSDEVWAVDVTDLARPVLLSIWQPSGDITRNVRRGLFYTTTIQRVRASSDGKRAYAACGDAGTFVIDLTDPLKPRTLARTEYAADDEGNAFDATEVAGGHVLVTADSDVDSAPAGVSMQVLNPSTLRRVRPYPAIEPDFTRQLAASGPIRGEVVYVGSALPGAPLLADPRGKIALVDRIRIVPDNPNGNGRALRAQASMQAQRALEAGAVAVLFDGLISRWPETRETAAIPSVSIETGLADALRGEIAKNQKVEVEFAAGAATFGFLRLWDLAAPGREIASQIGMFAAPAARSSVGHFSVTGNRLYGAWAREGVRVLDLSDPLQPREIGHFTRPDDPSFYIAAVAAHNGLVLATSTGSFSLWILRDAAP